MWRWSGAAEGGGMVWYGMTASRNGGAWWYGYCMYLGSTDGTGSSSRARPDSTTGPGTPNNVGPEQMLTTCGRTGADDASAQRESGLWAARLAVGFLAGAAIFFPGPACRHRTHSQVPQPGPARLACQAPARLHFYLYTTAASTINRSASESQRPRPLCCCCSHLRQPRACDCCSARL